MIKPRKCKNRSAGKLVEPIETKNNEQGPSGSGKNEERDDEEKEDHQPEELMEQDTDQVRRDGDKALLGCASWTKMKKEQKRWKGRRTQLKVKLSTLEPPSAIMKAALRLPESSTPGKIEITTVKLLTESPRRRKKRMCSTTTYLGNPARIIGGSSPRRSWKKNRM